MTARIKVKVQRKATVKLKVLPRFPSDISVTGFLTLEKDAGNFALGIDYTKVSVGSPISISTAYVVFLDEQTGALNLISIGDLQGGASLSPLTTPTVFTGSGTILPASVIVQTNQSAAIALVAPSSTAWATQNSSYGVPLIIADASGNASTNNLTINRAGSDTFSGDTSLTINTDFGFARLIPKVGGGWIVV